jgi:hypothetical protein
VTTQALVQAGLAVPVQVLAQVGLVAAVQAIHARPLLVYQVNQ